MIDMKNQKVGYLTFLYPTQTKTKSRSMFWMCVCDCGKTKEINSASVKAGLVVSCGCFRKIQAIKANTKHGKSNTSTYKSWDSMVQRCTNKNKSRYKDYGGRGIFVCKDWLKFENFLRDMGEKPSKNYSIERINNNDGYFKENCKWATCFEQSENKRKISTNTSGFTGVSFYARKNKYIAYLQRDGKRKHLGYFASIDDAINARKEALLMAEYLRRQMD